MKVESVDHLIEIFEKDSEDWIGDNALQGLNILAKYVPKNKYVLQGANKDTIYSFDLDKAIEYGITVEDAEQLRKINWMIDYDSDCLACFV